MKKPNYFPSLDKFKELAAPGTIVPVFRDILADTDTPVSAFLKIDDGHSAFLLESVEGGEKWGRYSLLGNRPRMTVRSKENIIEVHREEGVSKIQGDPITTVKRLLDEYKAVDMPGIPRFSGGAIGYIGYDMVRHFERLPELTKKDLDLFDLQFIFTDTFLVFDNVEQKIKVISNVCVDKDSDKDILYREAVEKIDSLVDMLGTGRIKKKNWIGVQSRSRISSNFRREDFLDAVERVKKYITEGDVIQTVISQRFSTRLDVDPFDIYRSLRIINPSPYMFFLRLDDVTLVGSSPEVLVRVEGNDVNLKPIAGTRKRGRDEEEDATLEKELLADPKERAEHIMLVDLGRNDLGRVCEAGTVAVDEFMTIERYSHVMHIVSNVTGRLVDGQGPFESLKASFPAGTLTGAPKIRAMEIIEELEPCRRGVYGGSVGYLSYTGNMDMCIAIRTLVIKDDKIHVQAGAGIVADSVPETEFEETENKARGLIKAIEMAREGLF